MYADTLVESIKNVFVNKTLPIEIHTESLRAWLSHPDELFLALAFRIGLFTRSKVPLETPEYLFCEEMLQKVSRSFALVITILPDDLRISVCIFYLVLRGLDTIEDDMKRFEGKLQTKVKLLRGFSKKLSSSNWSLQTVGEGDEKKVLEEFYKVLNVFHSLPQKDQTIITDICEKMANGMCEFLEKQIRLGTDSIEDYNLYCHYVAGLVGQGLTQLFVAHGNENKELLESMKEANEMGLFLQKVNIIRDFLEDLQEGRTFWPRTIWQNYAPSLLELRTGDKEKSLQCLNELIIDAYSHIPACLRYLEMLKDPKVFQFCAIPQVMAIATLERLANNVDVFTGVVKIRKGLMLSLFQYASTIEEVKGIFSTYSDAILSNIPSHHIAHKQAIPLVYQVQGMCVDGIQPQKPWPSFVSLLLSFSILIYSYFHTGKSQWMDFFLMLTLMIFMVFKKLSWFSGHMYPKDSS